MWKKSDLRKIFYLFIPSLALFALACGGDDHQAAPNGPMPSTFDPATASDGGVSPGSSAHMNGDAAIGVSRQDAGDDAPASASSDGAPHDPRLLAAPRPPACTPSAQVEPLYTYDGKIAGLALVADQLYFASYDDGLFSLPKAGATTAKNLSTDYTQDVAALGSTLYVAGVWSGTRFTAEQLASGAAGEEVSLDANLQSFSDSLYSYPDPLCIDDEQFFTRFDGQGKQTQYSLPCMTTSIGEQSGQLYAAADEDPDAIYSLSLSADEDTLATKFVQEKNIGFDLVTTEKYIYFTAYEVSDDQEYLMRAPLGGGPAEAVAGPFSVNVMLGDGNDVYLSDGPTGCLFRLDGKADKLEPLAKVALVEDLAFDASYVYVGTFGGLIGRIPR